MTHSALSKSKRMILAILVIVLSLNWGVALALETSEAVLSKSTTEANCIRHYIYKGRVYPVDSSRKMDGEGLRVVFKKYNPSEELLNSYQQNLRSSKIPAYFGTVGLLSLIIGPVYASTIDNTIGKRDTRYATIFGGASVLLGSYFWGIWNINRNENRLSSSVDQYNQAVDRAEQIQVNFTPTQTGDGGQIKTIVPFQF